MGNTISQDSFQKFLAVVLNERKADIVKLLQANGVPVTTSMSDKDVQIAFLKALSESDTFRAATVDYLSNVAMDAASQGGKINFVNQGMLGFVPQPGTVPLDFVNQPDKALDFVSQGNLGFVKQPGIGFVNQPGLNFVRQQELSFAKTKHAFNKKKFLNDSGDDLSSIDSGDDLSSIDSSDLASLDSSTLPTVTVTAASNPGITSSSAYSSGSSSSSSFFTPQLLNTALSGAVSIFSGIMNSNAAATSQANALQAAQMQLAAQHQAVVANTMITATWANTLMILGVVAIGGLVVYEIFKKKAA